MLPSRRWLVPRLELNGVSFRRANLDGVQLFNVDLSEARGFSTEQLASALGDSTTTLPPDVARPESWPNRELSFEEKRSAFLNTGLAPRKWSLADALDP